MEFATRQKTNLVSTIIDAWPCFLFGVFILHDFDLRLLQGGNDGESKPTRQQLKAETNIFLNAVHMCNTPPQDAKQSEEKYSVRTTNLLEIWLLSARSILRGFLPGTNIIEMF